MGKLISILYSETFKILKIFQLWLFLLSEMELQQVSSSSSKITASFLPADVPDFSAAGGYDILCPHKFPLDGPMKNSRAEIVSKLGNRWIGGIYHKKKAYVRGYPQKIWPQKHKNDTAPSFSDPEIQIDPFTFVN